MASCLLMSPRRILGDLALTRRSGPNSRWTAERIAISVAPLAAGIFKPGIGQSVHVSLKLQNSPISPCTTLVCEPESRRCLVGMLPTPPGTPLAARMRYHRPPPTTLTQSGISFAKASSHHFANTALMWLPVVKQKPTGRMDANILYTACIYMVHAQCTLHGSVGCVDNQYPFFFGVNSRLFW
jgi:hypothetical protein